VKERVITPLVLLLRFRPLLRLLTLMRWELLLWTRLGDWVIRREPPLSVEAPLCLTEASPCLKQVNLQIKIGF